MQNTDIPNLLELQKIENKIHERHTNIEGHKKRMDHINNQIKKRKELLNKNEEDLETQQSELKKKEKILFNLEEKKKKSNEHYKVAKSQVQVEALEKELKDLSPSIEALEDEILELLDSIDECEVKVKDGQNFLKGSKDTKEEIEKEVNEDIYDDEHAISVFQKKEDSFLELLSSEAKSLFEGLKKRYKSKEFITNIEKGKCKGCFYMLPSHLIESIYRGTNIECCPSCQRILAPNLD